MPSATRGVELLPVKGRLPGLFALNTDVELTVGPNDVLVPWPTTVVSPPKEALVVLVAAFVVVVTTSVDPDTSVELVDGFVVVPATVVVVSCGCVVVVVHSHVVVVGWCVVVVQSHVVVVGWFVVVVHSPQVVLVDGLVVEVELVLEVVVVDLVVVVVLEGWFEPQNCTLEMLGTFLLCPTFGKPAFEKEPVTCGGEIE